MLPLLKHPSTAHFGPNSNTESKTNFVADKSIFVTEVDDYDRWRSMLYALGAKGVAAKMMAHVSQVVHGRAQAPQKARAKYPTGEFVHADAILELFHQQIRSFGEFVRALETHGFRVRNPSDEGDPQCDYFDLPCVDDSLHATLLHYLATSEFIRKFATKQYFPIDKREDTYIDFPIPNTDVTWYYAWNVNAWDRVYATRGEGEYPLEIKGPQLLRVAPVLWKESTGLYFHEYPHIDSINGLFIQAGIDVRTGRVNGVAISRVWT